MMGFITLFQKETLNESRRIRQYLLRVGYVALVFALIVLFYRNDFQSFGVATSADAQAAKLTNLAFGLYAFTAISQLMLAALITPILVTASFQSEKRYGTLALLTMSQLRDRDVVLGKVFSKYLLVAMLVMAGVPVLTLIKVFGYVDLPLVIGNFVCSISLMLISGAIAAYYGLTAQRLVQAIAASYGTLLGLLTITLFAGFFARVLFNTQTIAGGHIANTLCFSINPAWGQSYLMGMQFEDAANKMSPQLFGLACGLQLIVSACIGWYFLLKAETHYRWWRLGLTAQAPAWTNPASRSDRGAVTEESQDPGDQARLRRDRLTTFRRIAFYVICGVLGIQLLAGMSGSIDVHRNFVLLMFGLLAVTATVLGGAEISQEQEDKTIMVLLTTPLSPLDILWMKTATLRTLLTQSVGLIVGGLLIFTIFGWIALNSFILVSVALAAFLLLISGISLCLSSLVPQPGKAITYALTLLVLVTLGTYMVGVLLTVAGGWFVTVGEQIKMLNPAVLIWTAMQPGPTSRQTVVDVDWSFIASSLLIVIALAVAVLALLRWRFEPWVRKNF